MLQTTYVADNGKEWICHNCHRSLTKGKIPGQAKVNNLELDEQPPQLKNLSPLELRLISQRIPFMKIVGLPRGRQQAIHGPAVNVPAKVDTVCQLFPRLPSECQIIPLKFKRRRKYKSHYMYDFVDPQKVLDALEWLKQNNPHYQDIDTNPQWVSEAQADDEELWKAMTGEPKTPENVSGENCPIVVETGYNNIVVRTNSNTVETVDLTDLTDLERKTGLSMIDVPRDGNCLYSAICYQLEKTLQYSTNVCSLRKQTADYMSNFPEMYKDFVSNRIEAEDSGNADTEQPTIADQVIAEATDPETQQELRWLRYLNGVKNGSQWGDHIVLQAIVDQYSLKVHVHKSLIMLKKFLLDIELTWNSI
jgi:hypothetical protein